MMTSGRYVVVYSPSGRPFKVYFPTDISPSESLGLINYVSRVVLVNGELMTLLHELVHLVDEKQSLTENQTEYIAKQLISFFKQNRGLIFDLFLLFY